MLLGIFWRPSRNSYFGLSLEPEKKTPCLGDLVLSEQNHHDLRAITTSLLCPSQAPGAW